MSVNISGVRVGARNPKLDGRIVGGYPTTIQLHPHQVKIVSYGSTRCAFDELTRRHKQVHVIIIIMMMIIIIIVVVIIRSYSVKFLRYISKCRYQNILFSPAFKG
jgi:hypothetical protein